MIPHLQRYETILFHLFTSSCHVISKVGKCPSFYTLENVPTFIQRSLQINEHALTAVRLKDHSFHSYAGDFESPGTFVNTPKVSKIAIRKRLFLQPKSSARIYIRPCSPSKYTNTPSFWEKAFCRRPEINLNYRSPQGDPRSWFSRPRFPLSPVSHLCSPPRVAYTSRNESAQKERMEGCSRCAS